MDVSTEAVAGMNARAGDREFEAAFQTYYVRLARVIGRVIRDPARAEELAVDVLLKWADAPAAHGDHAGGWLYRTAVRAALDELRRQRRRERGERLLQWIGVAATPEDVRAASEERDNVRAVLAGLRRRDAELLVLRSHGLTYEELASALRLNPASVGTLVGRAERAFRKEYVKRHGHT